METGPERCKLPKPKRGTCEVTERRFFLHATKGCKPSSYCAADLEINDGRDDLNYFVSEEDCIQTCMTREFKTHMSASLIAITLD